MHPLLDQLQPLLASEDVEGLTSLLESWQPRDDVWAECVEGRIYAPSTSDAQRHRLRAVRAAYRAEAAAAPKVTQPPVTPPAETATNPSELVLTELAAALADSSARVAALPHESRTPAIAVLDIVRREQLHQQVWRRGQYEDELAQRRVPSGTDFRAFLASVSESFIRLGPAASEAQLSALQSLSPVPLSEGLLAFYRTVGGINGEFGDGGLGLRLFTPKTLLDAHASSRPAERLTSLSLLDMVRWCWGNDRPELDPGALPAATERAARAMPCIGWISDGYGEEHGYLVQRTDGRFHLHCWHQDDDFTVPDTAAPPHAADLWTLLHEVTRRLEHASPDDAPIESLSELIDALETGGR